jgi:hypothetical protein
MHAVRALLLAFGFAACAVARAAEAEQLPPIFAPKPAPAPARAPRPLDNSIPLTPLRQAMSETILAAAKAFPATPMAEPSPAAPAVITSDGALLMPRFVVKSVPPSANEVERRPPIVQLGRFAPMERVDRRRTGLSMSLMSFGEGGSLELNVVNGAGFGLDHNIDFTRVELAFRFRF